MAHTPGPWSMPSTLTYTIVGAIGQVVTSMRTGRDISAQEAISNARFIVQACNAHEDLLAALDGLLATEDSESGNCQWCTEEVDGDECTNPECPGVKAHAAIAKATGI